MEEPSPKRPPLPSKTAKSQQLWCLNDDDNEKCDSRRRQSMSALEGQPHFLKGMNLNQVSALSIPDPPSPNHQLLSPSLKSPQLPFQDRSNSKASAKSISNKRTSRKSLCHVPSPAIETNVEAKEAEKTLESPTKRQRTASFDHSTAKKTKSDTQSSGMKNTVQTPLQSISAVEGNIPLVYREKLEDVRSLVHRYTSLRPAERDGSFEIKAIQDMTGYIITPPCTVGEDIRSVEGPNGIFAPSGEHLQALSKLSAELRQMDQHRGEYCKMVEEVTECRVEKHKGRYRYVHRSGRRVVTNEYEQRYMLMLQAMNEVRSADWLEYFTSLQDTSTKLPLKSPMTDRSHEKVIAATLTPVLHEMVPTADDEDEEVSDPNEEEANAAVPTTPTQVPLPSRESPSTDPEIAAAEAKLWIAFDAALAEYSAEIVAIQTRRRQQA